MAKNGFPVKLRCSRCWEEANYTFSTERSREEYFDLWALRHKTFKAKFEKQPEAPAAETAKQ